MIWLSLRSLWNRRFVAALTVLSIGLSVALILGVERLREEARDGFTNSVSGIDLIVAPRGNSVQILMATVFGVGTTGAGLGWETFEQVENTPQVAWAVPIQMGDNHRGFPVIGTSTAYFEYFKHSGGQSLMLAKGRMFDDHASDGAVVGAEVAERFGYTPGTVIVNAHGEGSYSFDMHDDAPFTITGVLVPTGTAVDRMVFVSLQGFDNIHATRMPPPEDPFDVAVGRSDVTKAEDSAADFSKDHAENEHAESEEHVDHEEHDYDAHAKDSVAPDDHHHEPETINAIFVGLSERTAVLGIQRLLSELQTDPVSAVMPAVALAELWGITGTAENVMRVMAWAVAVAGLIGMLVMLSATLDTRRREFAILRSVGATPTRIFGMIITEAAVLTVAGLLVGMALLTLATFAANPLLAARFGVTLDFVAFGGRELLILGAIFCAGLISALVPAIRVYRITLADGLSVRI